MIRSGTWIALAAATITVIVGCGDEGHRLTRQKAPPKGAVRASSRRRFPFRWMAPVAGPQPSIAEENRRPGTSAWRLPGPAADLGGVASGSISGYVSEQAVLPGQLERIYVSAPGARSGRIRIFRMGWYGGAGGREVLVSDPLALARQPRCRHSWRTGLTACGWHPTLTFRIPPGLASGVYIARLSASDGQSDCLFVVRSRVTPALLAQLPTATYQAYNAWGGDSLYPGGIDPVRATGARQGIAVSLDRPYGSLTGAGQFFARDVAMIRFLERYRYPVGYTTSESVDQDPGQLRGPRALIDFGHSEYWSRRQQHGFAAALRHGASLLWFGSDTLAWRVRYARAATGTSDPGDRDRTIVAYKEHAALDPQRTERTGAFADRGAGLADSAYLGCITPRLHRPGPPTYRYYPWSPAPALKPSWLFAHTGVSARTVIPGIVGYELDQRTPAAPPGTRLLGGGSAPCMADGVSEPGAPFRGSGQGRADTTLYTAPSGAIVFDTGTLGWELGLSPVPSASPDAPRSPDPRLVAITRNLLAHVLRRGPGPSARLG